MKKDKIINKFFIASFLGVLLFFLFNSAKIIFKERKAEKTQVMESLYKNKEKLDLTLKYLIWDEAEKVDYNKILENYIFYKKEIKLKNSLFLYKIPYKETGSTNMGRNAVLLIKNYKNQDIGDKFISDNNLKTLDEIKNILNIQGIKDFKIILENPGTDYTSFFSLEEKEEIIEKYFEESLKYPIVSDNNLTFYKKEKDKIYIAAIQNYEYIFKNSIGAGEIQKYSYFFIVSPSTRYIFHPKKGMMNIDISLEAAIDKDKKLKKQALALYNEDFLESYSNLKKNKITSQSSVMGFIKLSEIPFYLGVISLKEDLMLESTLKFCNLLTQVLVLFSFLNFFYFIFNLKRKNNYGLYFISYFQFILLFIFIVTNNSYSVKKEIGKYIPITSKIEIEKYLRKNKLFKDFKIKIDVDTIEFLGANNVKITGMIEHKNNSQSCFFFPDATEYEEKIIFSNKKTTIKQFSVVLREKFEYNKYPLDSNIIWLRIRSNSYDNKKVIIPDVDKYDNLVFVSSNSGINKDIVLNGWDIKGSFFSFNEYTPEKYELLYNICLKREMLNPFISTVLPILIILIIIFGILVLLEENKNESRIEFILGSVSGLFFTIIISQNNLREQIGTNELLYLDYYYFLIYIILIVIIFLSFAHKYKKISYNKIHILKKIFWFMIFLIFFIVTYFQFKI